MNEWQNMVEKLLRKWTLSCKCVGGEILSKLRRGRVRHYVTALFWHTGLFVLRKIWQIRLLQIKMSFEHHLSFMVITVQDGWTVPAGLSSIKHLIDKLLNHS